jgi:hypothetical protein
MSTTVTSPSIWVAAPNTGDGTRVLNASDELLAVYGGTPVAQRAASIQAASVVSVSSNITIAASLTAWILEVTNTLVGLTIWKGSA